MTAVPEVVSPTQLPAAVGLSLTLIRWTCICLSAGLVRAGWLFTELLQMPVTPKNSACSQVSESGWPGSSIPGLLPSRRVNVGLDLPFPEPCGSVCGRRTEYPPTRLSWGGGLCGSVRDDIQHTRWILSAAPRPLPSPAPSQKENIGNSL